MQYSLKNQITGIEEDGVTVKRQPFVAVNYSGSLHHEKIRTALELSGIDYHEYEGYIGIAVDQMFHCIRVLEDSGLKTEDHVPFFLVEHILKKQQETENTETTEETIVKNIGPLWDKLRAFQKVAVRRAVICKKFYIADDMGSGKTLQSIAICKHFESKWPVLILCPAILKNTWKNEIIKWLGIDTNQIFVLNSTKHLKNIVEHKFLIVSYGLIHKPEVETHLKHGYDVVILDEAHYIKSLSSKRSKTGVAVAQSASIRLLLSGTPFSYPSEMYQQIKALYPEIYPWFFNFRTGVPNVGQYFYASRYCHPELVRAGDTKQWQFKGYENSDELTTLLSTIMIRRRKKDILPFLPSKTRSCITLDELKKKEYKEISSLLSEEKGVEAKSNSSANFMQSFRLTCKYKIPHAIEFIKQYIVQDMLVEDPQVKVLIFAHHVIMREAVQKCLTSLRVPFFSIHGSVNEKQRAQFEHEFQNTEKYRVGVLSVSAACTGLTLTKASVVVFTELLFGPDIMFQAEDRVHRIGQKCNVNIFYLITPKTTDDINWGLIKKKERESSQILDGEKHIVVSDRIPAERTKNLLLSDKRPRVDTNNRIVTKRMKQNLQNA
jgi:SWI/SNF-related matrix-associated actin-dependent regulator 1 of chromatin subfamily A